MLLTIDIGNTTTTVGCFRGKRLSGGFSVATHPNRTPDEVAAQLASLGARHHVAWSRVRTTILCSVVPRMTSVVVEALQRIGRSRVCIVGQDLSVPLRNRYAYPEQVGQDRLVAAYAAWKEFKKDCIIADFGTAMTIDLVTKAGEYLGGVIAPGLELSLEALASRTALLPKVDLQEPPELLGRDTANSIRSGVLHGTVALCDGLIVQLKSRYVPRATVVATGGSGVLVVKHSRQIDHHRPHLILQGLFEIYSK